MPRSHSTDAPWAVANPLPNGAFFRLVGGADSSLRFAHLTDGLTGVTGVSAADAIDDADAFLERILPPDRGRFLAALGQPHVPAAALEIDIRLLGPGGEIRWAEVRATASASGEPAWDGVIFDVTDRKRAELLLTAENRLSGLLTEFPAEPELWPALLPLVADESQWDVAECWRIAGDGGQLRRTAAWIRPDAGMERFACESEGWTFFAGDGLPGIAWRAGEPVWMPDLKTESSFKRRELALACGINCGVGVPIRVGGECVGVVALFARPVGQDFPAMRTFTRTLGRTLSRYIEHQKAEDAVRQARDAAERANRAKDRFLATVSHELRTPLAGILGTVDLALADTGAEPVRERLDTIRDAAGSLLGIVNDLLDFAKVRAGRLDLNPVAFDLKGDVARAVRTLADRARAKGLRFDVVFADDVPTWVNGDAGRLRQVLVNLVGNAVKFTDRGGVTVKVDFCKGRVRFRVQDTGIGIPADKLAAVFRPFEQADDSAERRFGGTGLGLAIADRLVRRMGGRIRVRSESEKGSTFTFAVRLQSAHAPDAVTCAPAVALPPLRILLAEDDEILRDVTAEILRRAGHTVTAVRDGSEAIAAAVTRFDAIVMDIQMPGTGGETAAVAIRSADAGRGRRTPILAFTAGSSPPKDLASFDGFVQKPADTTALLGGLARVLGFATGPVPKGLDPAAELLSRVGGDPGILASLAPRLAEDSVRLVTALRGEVSTGQYPAAARLAHRLIGLIGLLSTVGCESARRLELAAEAGDAARVAAELTILERIAASLPAEVRERLNSHQ